LRTPREQISKVADFLRVPLPVEAVDVLLEVTSKSYMAKNIAWISPDLAVSIGRGGRDFFQGVKHGWKELLSAKALIQYRATASQELDDEIAEWLAFPSA
jgi:hypothetical protein